MTDTRISLEARIRRAEDAAWRMIDGQAVVVSTNAQRMRVLNEVGSRVWELADGRSLREISVVLAAEFEADPSVIEADALSFAQDLVSRGMLIVEPQ